jgi:glycogen debranching enzyme
MAKPQPNWTSDNKAPLGRLRPRNSTVYTSRDRTVMATSPDGFIFKHNEHGLWVYQCRMLSRYRWLINGQPPLMVSNSNLEQHSWLGYYITSTQALQDAVEPDPQHSIELRLSRQVGPGMHEDIDITNFTQSQVSFFLELEIESDFADPKEAGHKRMQWGKLRKSWREQKGNRGELSFDYQVHHRYAHQGNRGLAKLHRGMLLQVDHADSKPEYRKNSLRFSVELAAHGSWHACLKWLPRIDERTMTIASGCHFSKEDSQEQKRLTFLEESTSFSSPENRTLTATVLGTLDQSKRDLAALRLYDLDRKDGTWTLAAGLPTYVALVGRDSLAASWEALMLSQDMCIGTLQDLANWQGTEINDWRDEQPGKIIHELHTNPLSVLNFDPHARYYGGVTGAIYFGTVVSGLWHWTGDKDLVRPLVRTALKGLRWAGQYGDINGDGFCKYLTRSEQGEKNQGWKDSGDAIVYEDGTQVPDPLGTCEMQAFIYASKLHLSELLWWLEDFDTAKQLFHEADELKKKFNEKFWMEDQGYLAMGIDGKGRQIKSIASDPGHCLASGIVDSTLAERVAKRMMADDMFSGWGVRTLSARHPAFNPYAYHRGTVWPVENAVFTLAFARYGLHSLMHHLAGAQFRTAALFDYFRLPEVIAGHQRDARHPIPAIYPRANWPQAWSASAPITILQAILGIYPYAPLKALLLDPHLPEWLPDMSLHGLRVGQARVDLRFYRKPDGSSDYEILNKRGRLHVIRQPSPWSLTAGWGERIKDAIESLLPDK